MTNREKILIKALEYYATQYNWGDTHKGDKPSYRVIKDDAVARPSAIYGGRRARQALEDIGYEAPYLTIKDSWHD